MRELEGKLAVVTGTSGIGRAIALNFAMNGARVMACGIDDGANTDLQTEASRQNLPLEVERCDVSDAVSVQQAVETAAQKLGGIDILVNAAAIHPFGTVLETEPEAWNRCMAVNVGGIYLMSRAAIPEMQKRGSGAIINLASVQGFACQRGVAAYATSKGAILSLTRSLALDYARDKIRVNSICPGAIETPMLARSADHFGPGMPHEIVFARFGAAHPLGRIGTPEEIAELAVFLASDKASFCTGGAFVADGGLLAGIGVS